MTFMKMQTRRIVFDARMVKGIPDGIARHAFELVNAIARLSPPFRLYVLLSDPRASSFFTPSSHVELVENQALFLSLSEQWKISRTVREIDPSLCHFPSFVVPRGVNKPYFVTIHDLNHWRFPQYYRPWHRLYYRALVLPAVKAARVVLTVSRFSQQELMRCWNLPEKSIEVISNGVNRAHFAPTPSLLSVAAVKRKYRLPPSFVLYVGGDKPHKNWSTMLAAMHSLSLSKKPPLIAIGSFRERESLSSHSVSSSVRFLSVEDHDLPVIYALAQIVCFPSLYEGFGFPILEAHSCGTPVITSSTTACKEIAGNAALTIDPTRPEELSRAIASLLQDNPLRNKLRQEGFARASQFSWDDAAKKLIELYQRFI